MVFLRSEEHLGRWLSKTGRPRGASMGSTTLNELARGWWWTRLEPDWRPRTLAESRAILDDVGLTGEFWRLA